MNEQMNGRTRLVWKQSKVFFAKGKADGKTINLWGFIEENSDLFRLEWLFDFSCSLQISLFPKSHYFLDFIALNLGLFRQRESENCG